MFNKILIPLDGSAQAENALQPGLTLAKAAGAELLLLRVPVYKEAPSTAAAVFDFLRPELTKEETRLQAERYLKSTLQMQMGSGVAISLLTTGDNAAETIVDTAVAEQIDLIVMSTHGRTGLKRWFFGSVTEKVVRAAPCPLLIVRSAAVPRKLLITLDGSEMAERALAPALELARRWQTAVTLLRVVELPDDEELPTPNLPANKAAAVREKIAALAQQEAEEYLQAVTAGLEMEVETVVLVGLISETILDYAKREGFGLIALSSQGERPEARWAYGSVAEKVIHGSESGVLIIPTNGMGQKAAEI
jgi:nucleotide-binding universal stress UspA family protein